MLQYLKKTFHQVTSFLKKSKKIESLWIGNIFIDKHKEIEKELYKNKKVNE